MTASAPAIRDITVYLESIGTLQPTVFMEIRPQVNGTLQEVFVDEGQWVQKETPLFKIDPKPYEIKVQEVEAQLTMDKAALKGTQKNWSASGKLAQKDLIAQTEWDDLEAEAEKGASGY